MRTLLLIGLGLTACFRTSGPAASDTASSAGSTAVSAPSDTDLPQDITAWRRWTQPADDARAVPDAPNVVLVVLCTWRADQLGPWGGAEQAAPTLSRLARQGVVFDKTIAQAPWTRPAVGSILTGHYPQDLGLADPGPKASSRALPPSAVTLPERLHQAGWSTVGVVTNPNLSAAWGFDQGFDVYIESFGRQPVATQEPDAHHTQAARLALAELAARPDPARPTLVELVLVQAHAPRHATAQEVERFRAPGLPERVARYRASLRRADAVVDELLRGLPAVGMDPDNTLVVLVGDHGEGLSMPASHGPGHGFMLYPSVTHVPLVVAGPGVPAGGRIGGLTTQLDVTPTVLGLLGQEVDATLPGQDLSGAVRSGSGTASRPAAYSATRFRWADRSAVLTDDLHCQIDHDPKATATSISQGRLLPFSTGCCRYTSDPACDRPEWDDEVLDGLRTWRQARERAAKQVKPVQVEANQVLREQLRALGYTE